MASVQPRAINSTQSLALAATHGHRRHVQIAMPDPRLGLCATTSTKPFMMRSSLASLHWRRHTYNCGRPRTSHVVVRVRLLMLWFVVDVNSGHGCDHRQRGGQLDHLADARPDRLRSFCPIAKLDRWVGRASLDSTGCRVDLTGDLVTSSRELEERSGRHKRREPQHDLAPRKAEPTNRETATRTRSPIRTQRRLEPKPG